MILAWYNGEEYSDWHVYLIEIDDIDPEKAFTFMSTMQPRGSRIALLETVEWYDDGAHTLAHFCRNCTRDTVRALRELGDKPTIDDVLSIWRGYNAASWGDKYAELTRSVLDVIAALEAP